MEIKIEGELGETLAAHAEGMGLTPQELVTKFLEQYFEFRYKSDVPIGTRVRVKDGAGEKFIGEGTYVGRVTVYVVRTPDGRLLSNKIAETPPSAVPEESIFRIPRNPKIQLDNGEIVYGCQVWWEPIGNVKDS